MELRTLSPITGHNMSEIQVSELLLFCSNVRLLPCPGVSQARIPFFCEASRFNRHIGKDLQPGVKIWSGRIPSAQKGAAAGYPTAQEGSFRVTVSWHFVFFSLPQREPSRRLVSKTLMEAQRWPDQDRQGPVCVVMAETRPAKCDNFPL